MDGFFGIGIGELVLIAIVALIVLGPERLPSALREVAKFIRWLRDLSREFTDQFGDEFKALEDLNPRRILQDAITSIDEEEKAKEDPKSTKKPTTSSTTPAKTTAVKTTTAKPTTPATTGIKTTSASTPKPKPVTPKAADSSKTVARESTAAAAGATTTEAAPTAQPDNMETVPENRIAPPSVEAATASAAAVRMNGHHADGETNAIAPANPTPSEPAIEREIVASHQQAGEETREG